MSAYTDWQAGIVNRNYHILQTLAKDERVDKIIAVDFLPLGFGWLRKIKYYYNNLIKGVVACDDQKKVCLNGETMFGDLTSRCYQITSKIYVYSSVNKLTTVISELAKIKTRLALNNLLIWSYNPLLDNLAEIKNRLNAQGVIFDAVDDWSVHSVYQKQKELLQQNYQKIKQDADIIFTVSLELKQQLFSDLPKVAWVPNGVNVEKFSSPINSDLPADLKNINQPIVGYIGMIQNRLDWDLIKYLAEKNRDKSFVFIGWIWREAQELINQKLKQLPNVHFLGRKDYNELPQYLKHFQAAIIPHKINDFTKSMNPLKMYEYLAAGLPIVSTKVAGVDDFSSLIKIAHNSEEFDQYLNEVIANNSVESKQDRISAAQNCSWENRVEKMLNIIAKSLDFFN